MLKLQMKKDELDKERGKEQRQYERERKRENRGGERERNRERDRERQRDREKERDHESQVELKRLEMKHEKEIARTNYETTRLQVELNGQRLGVADEGDDWQSRRRNEIHFDVGWQKLSD